MSIEPTVVDLCCGAGGFSEGFRQAGFKILLGVDVWRTALNTYRLNQKTNVLQADITTLVKIPKCDVLIGSPPCQSFSRANKNKNKQIDTKTIPAFLNLVKQSEAKYWVMEEVPDVLKYYPELKRYASIIPANLFGVEQLRKRVFVGNYPGIFALRWVKHKYPTVTATEYKGKSWKWCRGRLSDYFGRTATVEECKKVMCFPENYVFVGTKKDQYIQIGNAVCPPVSKAIADAIMSQLPHAKSCEACHSSFR